ncbi:MAG: FtsX-like permease family protein [Myxococcota bacterium]
MEPATAIWEALLGVGTTLTLAVIVMIALALGALALFYVSSAVVVLERFARTVTQVRWVTLFGAMTASVATYLALGSGVDSLLAGPDEPLGLAGVLAAMAGLTLLAILLCRGALRLLSPARIGTVTLVGLGLAASGMIGATGRLGFSLAPPVAVGIVVAMLMLRRRFRIGARRPRGTTEIQLLAFAASLLVGPFLAVVLREPDPGVAAAGGALLQLIWVLILLGLLPLAMAGLVEMRNSAEWFLAVRYLLARRRQVYISAITLLCIGGIAAGVWLIVTVLSVMNGFERAWREQIVGDLAHFTVHNGIGRMSEYEPILESVRAVPGVRAASPYFDAEGMVRSDSGKLFGIRLRGVDAETVDSVTNLSNRITQGSLDTLRGGAEGEAPSILIGAPLAEKLGATLGSDLVLISPFGGPPTPLGPAPRLKKFRVGAIYQAHLQQFGEVYTYVDLSDAQDFASVAGEIDGIEARTSDLYTSRRVADAVRERLDSPYYTRDWKDHFPVFFAALRDNRSMMILLLGMIMVVAAFMIVATLMMMIMEKSSDIAILKAMGAEDATIERVFAIEGALIGLAGTTLGVVAGLAVTSRLGWIQETIEAVTGVDTLPASIYQLSTLPADHDPAQLIWIVAMAMVLSLGATLVPARQGARFDPVEGLRSE